MNIRHVNRIKAKTAKTGLFWCGSCDRALVSDGIKCKFCGKREGREKKRRIRQKPVDLD